MHQPAASTRPPRTAWAAYAACALALLSAIPSFYWAAGGTIGLDTVGGAIEELARARDPAGVALGIGAGVLKVAGGVLALALVRPWGRRVPRRLLGGVAWAASVVLTLYVACWSRWGRWCWLVWSVPLVWLIARRCGGMCCCGTCGFWSGVCCWAWRPGSTVANPAIGEGDEPASDQGFAQNFWRPAQRTFAYRCPLLTGVSHRLRARRGPRRGSDRRTST